MSNIHQFFADICCEHFTNSSSVMIVKIYYLENKRRCEVNVETDVN